MSDDEENRNSTILNQFYEKPDSETSRVNESNLERPILEGMQPSDHYQEEELPHIIPIKTTD